MNTLFQDIRYAFRMMLKNPGITVIAIVILAVGIGVNTTIFSVVDTLVFRPFPFPDVDEVMTLWTVRDGKTDEKEGFSPADFRDLKAQNNLFEPMAAYASLESDVNITGSGHPEYVERAQVTSNFFRTLGVTPEQGRDFLPEEETPGQHRVAIVSHTLWQRRFNSDPNFVGTTLALNGENTTIIGILPRGYHYPLEMDLWTPLALTTEQWGDRTEQKLAVLGRLKKGVSQPQAQSTINTIWSGLSLQFPATHASQQVTVISFLRQNGDEITNAFSYTLLGAVAFVLLIACANVANLQLARSTARRKEIGIRAALGANRMRVLRQMLTESLVMALAAGLLGIMMAFWGIDLIKAALPQRIHQFVPMWEFMGINIRVLGFTSLIVLLTGAISGFTPAFHASRLNLSEILSDASRGSSDGKGRNRIRSALVISEVALALVLLVGSGLMIQGFVGLLNRNIGLDPNNVLTMRITLPEARYGEAHQMNSFYRLTYDRLSSLPGVESVGGANYLPADNNWDTVPAAIEGRPALKDSDFPRINRHIVSTDYLSTMRVPLVQGRMFMPSDDAQAAPVVVVSRSMAQQYWPGQDPVGRRIRIDTTPSVEARVNPDGAWRTVVGVVDDVTYFWFDRQPRATVYLPSEQAPRRWLNLMVRTTGDPTALSSAIRSEIASIDPDQAVADIRTMTAVIDERLVGVRISANLMAVFGLISLILAAVGLYSVMAYSVAQRTQEIGIRMAIGAGEKEVLRMVMRQGAGLAGIGLLIGLPVSYGLSVVLQNGLGAAMAFNITSFIVFTGALVVVSILASFIPARRATKVDPVVALRSE